MKLSEVTKQEATRAIEAVNELFKAVPKTRQMEYIGHLNDISLILEAVKRSIEK